MNNMDKDSEQIVANSQEVNSIFTGGMMANFFIDLLTMLVSLITLGLAYPAMICWKLKWKAKHTYLNGKLLIFDGNAMQLFGKFIWWMFLSLITLGLYYIFSAKLKLTEWETKHTHFANLRFEDENNQSKFNGKWYQLFGVNFVSRFVILITLTIGYYWAHCYKERWYCKHKKIDGCELEFNGTGMQYFGKRIVWTLLTIITFGIYAFWLQIKSIKWTVSHTRLVNLPPEECFVNNDGELLSAEREIKAHAHKILSIVGFILVLLAWCLLCFWGFSVNYVGVIGVLIGTAGLTLSAIVNATSDPSDIKNIKLSTVSITLILPMIFMFFVNHIISLIK